MRQINKIIVHCSATKRSQNISAAIIRSWHMTRKPVPFSDIGYHFYIRKGGILETGRPLERSGAHCKGENHDSIGICLEGGLAEDGTPENNFDEDQFNALWQIANGMMWRFGFTEIKGHRDYSPDKNNDGVITKDEWIKVCPCFNVKAWYNERNTKANRRKSKVEKPAKNGVDKLHSSDNNNSTSNMETTKPSKPKRKRKSRKSSTNTTIG